MSGDITPELLVVVDTEEEFDWYQPFARSNVATRSLPAQRAAQEVYQRLGLVPTYVVGYPVALDPIGSAMLRRWKDDGQAEIGAHLHPWVTPPHREAVNAFNSYHCNLPPALERAKIEALTEAITAAFGDAPTVFKAGRHGFGPSTQRAITALGYKVDCSLLPYSDLRADGGPDHRRARVDPYWLDEAAELLEIPVTTGFFGFSPRLGQLMPRLFENAMAARLHLPGLLGRAGVVTRSRLTPEGTPVAEQCRLLKSLVRQGLRTFTLVYHSPSLAPGNTPYVRTDADLLRFLAAIEDAAVFFRDEIGGRFTTLTQVHARMQRELAVANAAYSPIPASPPATFATTRRPRRGAR